MSLVKRLERLELQQANKDGEWEMFHPDWNDPDNYMIRQVNYIETRMTMA